MISNNIKELTKYLGLYKGYLIIVLFSLATVSASLLTIGYVFKSLVDIGLSNNQIGAINNSIYLVTILIAIFSLGSFFRSYYINVVTEKVISKLKSDTHSNLLKIDLVRFEELKLGDIISRLGSDIENIGKLITNFLSFFIRNFIMLAGSITLMMIQSPKLSLLVVLGVPVLLFPLLRLSKHVRSLSKKVLSEQGMLAANIEENFSGIRTLIAYNQQIYAATKFKDKIDIYIKHSSKRLRLRSLFFALAISIIAGSITIIIWIGSIDIIQGAMSSGQMISFIYYAIIVGMSSGGIAELFSEIQSPLASLDRVLELKSIKQGRSNENNNKLSNSYSINFENVSFAYPARPDILALDNITFNIKERKFTGIVGRSGAGKSTIMQLLLKFYEHQKGIIKIGTTNIQNTKAEAIRKKISYVDQNSSIFGGTIKSNIMFSRQTASHKEIDKIAKICGISDFTHNLPDGLDTEIGEKGIRLSGGQKQRIVIARALLYNPEILLLDEATSALDNEGEKKLLQNIKKLLKGKTIISIAHRISSIEDADNILVINCGKLEISGNHNQLSKYSKLYNKLCKEQSATTK